MKWRELIVGSLLTLLVTVIGGVAIWYFTQEQPRAERIVYDVQSAANFGEGAKRLWFVNVRLENTGKQPAHNVRVVGALPLGAEVTDKSISFSSGEAGRLEDHSTPGALRLLLPSLVPNESISVSLLVRHPSAVSMDLKVRSDSSLGVKSVSDARKQDAHSKRMRIIYISFVALIALVIQFFGQKFLRDKLREFSNGYVNSMNNSAFILMQQGLIEESMQIFKREIDKKGGNSLVLSNFGASLALSGDRAIGERYMSAAEAWGGSKHIRAVMYFNRSTVHFAENEMDKGINALNSAISLSKREITWYCTLSIHIEKAMTIDDRVRRIVVKRTEDLTPWAN